MNGRLVYERLLILVYLFLIDELPDIFSSNQIEGIFKYSNYHSHQRWG